MSGVHIDSSDPSCGSTSVVYLEVAWSAAERVNWRWTQSAYTLYDERGMRAVAMERGVSASPACSPPSPRRRPMATRCVVVGSKVGLHARPAVLRPSSEPTTSEGDDRQGGHEPVRAGSILMVLGLDVRGSEEVVLCADGDAAEPALTSWLTWSRDLDALGHD
jgi:phosphocarrier protein HPr